MVREIDNVKIVIMGDLNADPSAPSSDKLQDFAYPNNLPIHFDTPTRIEKK